MSAIVPANDGESELLRELALVEQAGEYAIKGYSVSRISQLLEVTQKRAKSLVNEYYAIVRQQADSDPFFLEQIQFNTVKALKELDEISVQAWETVQMADDNEMINARLQALKLALDVSTKKAQLHNLLSGAAKSGDSDAIARMNKIESVNQILSKVLQEVVAGCPRCKELARTRLAEAFSLMDDDYEDAEVSDD